MASTRPQRAQQVFQPPYGRAPLSSEAVLYSLWPENRRSGFERHAATFRARCLLHRRIHLGDDALLLLLVDFGVSLCRARTIGPPDVPRRQRVASRHPEARRDVLPRTLILRLFLGPDDLL